MSGKNSIFFDLDIDASDSLSNPEEFAERVREAANKLRDKLSKNASIRVSEMTERFRNEAMVNKDAEAEAKEALQTILNTIGSLSEEAMVHLTTLMPTVSRSLHAEIESAAYNRYKSDDEEEPMDKKTTHMLYIELRRVFNLWVGFQNAYSSKPLFAELPAIPGNFSSASTGIAKNKTIVTFNVDGHTFYAHSGLMRYLNMTYPSLNLILLDKMAAIDWVHENGETYKVTIKEIKG